MDTEVFTDQDDFLAKVHTCFLQNVQPRESGLMDELRAEGVLSSDDENAVMAQETRRDKSRKLWELLHRVPPALFQKSCLPAMKTHYPHVVQGTVFYFESSKTDGGECFRHLVMKRMTLRRFADVFPSTKGCTLNEYRTITEDFAFDESKWKLVFNLCQKNWKNAEFGNLLRETLLAVDVGLPKDLSAFLSSGFPCCCNMTTDGKRVKKVLDINENAPQTHPSISKRKNDPQLQNDGLFLAPTKRMKSRNSPRSTPGLSSCGYPCTVDNEGNEGRDSVSLSSRESAEANVDRCENPEFQTKAQKDLFLQQMEVINNAIKRACSIRPLSRELSGIRDELSILQQEYQTMTNLSYLEEGRIRRLGGRAKDIYQKLKKTFEQASELKNDLDTSENSFHLPFKWKTILLSRRHMLANDITEATSFFQQSEAVYLSLAVPKVQSPTLVVGGNVVPDVNLFLDAGMSPDDCNSSKTDTCIDLTLSDLELPFETAEIEVNDESSVNTNADFTIEQNSYF